MESRCELADTDTAHETASRKSGNWFVVLTTSGSISTAIAEADTSRTTRPTTGWTRRSTQRIRVEMFVDLPARCQCSTAGKIQRIAHTLGTSKRCRKWPDAARERCENARMLSRTLSALRHTTDGTKDRWKSKRTRACVGISAGAASWDTTSTGATVTVRVSVSQDDTTNSPNDGAAASATLTNMTTRCKNDSKRQTKSNHAEVEFPPRIRTLRGSPGKSIENSLTNTSDPRHRITGAARAALN